MRSAGAVAGMARRSFLSGLAASLSFYWRSAHAHDVGPLNPPLEVPEVAITSSDGLHAPLRDLLRGRVTAIQLMFTQCKSICPIEAATLARVQEALGDHPPDDIRLLSLSIDPITDTPEVLRIWLQQFGARPGWTAASPAEDDLPRVRTFFERCPNLGEIHATAVNLVDRSGLLVWRTLDLPSPTEVAQLLLRLRR
jgi:protein SCO1/2